MASVSPGIAARSVRAQVLPRLEDDALVLGQRLSRMVRPRPGA